jgi:hypothetical protein
LIKKDFGVGVAPRNVVGAKRFPSTASSQD